METRARELDSRTARYCVSARSILSVRAGHAADGAPGGGKRIGCGDQQRVCALTENVSLIENGKVSLYSSIR